MVRLYPDIIVATAINNQLTLYKTFESKVPLELYLNIGHLLDLQESISQFGFSDTPMIGYESGSWNIDDYEKYFDSFSKYFICSSYGVWLVKSEVLKEFDYRKILEYGYTADVLKKLGLLKRCE